MTSTQNCGKVSISTRSGTFSSNSSNSSSTSSSNNVSTVLQHQSQPPPHQQLVITVSTSSSASPTTTAPAIVIGSAGAAATNHATTAAASASSAAAVAAAAAAAAAAGSVSPYTGRQMSRQVLEEFMVAYRHNQCLWKIKSKDYLNKDLKFEAYKQLVQICRKEHRTAGREFVVKKINSLRGSFRREYKRVISEENYVPQLWFYDLMQFTADQETSDEMNSAAAAAGGGAHLGGSGGGAGGSYGGGCYEYNSFGDDSLRDKFKSEDDENSNSNLSYQILQAYDPNTDEYAHCLENDTVEQELIINSTNPMVDGNGQEAVAASAAVISESTSVGLDYIANNLNIQHHETCPSVAAEAVLDDVEENIIEPDVILPAALMSDDSSPGTVHEMSCSELLTPTTSMSGGFANGGGGGGGSGAGTLSGRGSTVHTHRSRRTLRRYGIHKDNGSGAAGGNGIKPTSAYDEFMAFGVTVAAKLSRMSTYQRLYAENIINQTLFKGMLNQLQPPESVVDGSSSAYTFGAMQQQHQREANRSPATSSNHCSPMAIKRESPS